jgi:Golgi apparatus protein 1
MLLLNFTLDADRDNEDALPPKCIAEMEAHRRQIMNDFQISPELVVKCAKDLQVFFYFKYLNTPKP